MRPHAPLGWVRALPPLLLGLLLVVVLAVHSLVRPGSAQAAPGLCVGPVCGDTFSRSERYPWQLRMRVQDQAGHRERLLVDCRDGAISPQEGSVERGYAAALGRRACRMAPLSAPNPPRRDAG
ncbi:MAG: hypothetical protein ACK5QW_05185 [Cyanobacteriota bacterium]